MLFSAKTNSKEWRLVRKGTAPAFVSKNIRSPLLAAIKWAKGLKVGVNVLQKLVSVSLSFENKLWATALHR